MVGTKTLWGSKTKAMNFEVGGRRFYAMVSPEGHEKLVGSKIYFHYTQN
jgi:hypothetical protein